MTKVIFDESNTGSQSASNNVGGIMGFLIKKGIAKDTKSANLIMIVASVVFLVVAGYVSYINVFPQSHVDKNSKAYMISQKTQEYIKQGMSPIQARRKAIEEIIS